MDAIVFAACGGALILFGFSHRASATRAYWRQMNHHAEQGTQADERPRLEAGRSAANTNANIAIGVGVVMILALIFN